MKNLKTKFGIIILICLFSLLVIPIILELSGYRETMTDYVNFSDYNTIDRINISDVSSNLTYAYCLGGTVKCKSDTGKLIDISNTDYNSGKTYKSTCDTGDYAICSGNLFSSVVSYNLPSYVLPEGTQFPLSEVNIGFTAPYSYVPVELDSSNNFNIYNSTKTLMEKIHKCNLLSYDKQSNCYAKFFTNNEMNTQTLSSMTSSSNIDTSNIADSTKCGSYDKIPCLADYGTNIGENLCCGQTGVLQNTKYICPITRPKCSNFKCGTQFGNCE